MQNFQQLDLSWIGVHGKHLWARWENGTTKTKEQILGFISTGIWVKTNRNEKDRNYWENFRMILKRERRDEWREKFSM
ncbi:MAG: hypothetical protein WC991_14555 [Castellaniella sp.]